MQTAAITAQDFLEYQNELYLGIDPGVTGAFAVIDRDARVVSAFPFPETPATLYNQLITFKIKLAAIEHVHASPLMGKTSAFTFGKNLGIWHGILTALCIPFIEVTPSKWQKSVFDSVRKGESKELSVAFVNKRFPNMQLRASHHGKADAVCLALYVRNLDLLSKQ